MITRWFCSRSGRVDRLLRKALGDTQTPDQTPSVTNKRKNQVSKFSLKGLKMDDSMFDTSRAEVTVRPFRKPRNERKESREAAIQPQAEPAVKIAAKAPPVQEYLLKDDLDETPVTTDSKNSWPKQYFPSHFIKQ